MNYEGKVTLVTGGSHGIGEGCVRVFAEAGSTVVFCSRGEKDGRALEHKVNAGGPGPGALPPLRRVEGGRGPRARGRDGEALRAHRLPDQQRRAGTRPTVPIDGFTAQDLRDLLELNLVSAFVACQQALPHLRRTQGNIINMSSLVGSIGQLHGTTYVATKGALTAFSKALAVDEAAHGVRVNSVSPGNVWTPLWNESADTTADPERARAEGEAAQLLGRMGTIEEVGRLCLFLAAGATFTTGVDHVLSGGAELAYGRKSRVS